MLVAIIGKLGSGKTATLTFLAYYFYRKNKQIYANYKLNFPYKPIKTYQDLTNAKFGYFFADELWLWLDSRCAMTKRNQIINEILMKSRKRGINIFYTTQNYKQVDVRIRNVTDYIITPQLLYPTRIKRKKVLSPIIQNFFNPIKPDPEKIVIKADLYHISTQGNLFQELSFRFKLKDVLNLYDTREEIEQIKNTLEKAIEQEREFYEYLKKTYPNDKITLMPKSGIHTKSLDIEQITTDNRIIIYDVCGITKSTHGNFIDLRSKNLEAIREMIENGKEVNFIFKIEGEFWKMQITKEIIELYKKKKAITINRCITLGARPLQKTPEALTASNHQNSTQ